jgi:Tfp pilus assembly protein PilN
MIEINLLPEELRNKAVKVNKPENVSGAAGLEPKHYLLIIPLIFALLVCAQLIAGITSVVRFGRISALNGKWERLQSDRKSLEEFNDKYNVVSGDTLALQQLMKDRISWSEKLNKLSLYLPSGVWFEEISANSKELVLKGAVISLNKEELNLINQFIGKLKSDPVFFKDFNTFELGSAQKNTLGSYDITEVTLNATLKAK